MSIERSIEKQNASESAAKDLKPLIDAAVEARAHALTFRTSVGIAFETYDGKILSGFNIETYGHKGEHAEEVGLMRLLGEGYMGTDVRRMVEIFQDPGHNKAEKFPACFTCWARLWEFTHPYLEIIVVDVQGDIQWSGTLKQLFASIEESGAEIFPSSESRKAKPKLNFKPKLPLAEELMQFYREDEHFREYCDAVLHVVVPGTTPPEELIRVKSDA